MDTLNVVFMGSAGLSCPSLSALLKDARFRVSAVVTQPDRPKGRHMKLSASPVKEMAIEHGLPVLQPERARETPFIEQLQRLKPDIVAVVAYGQILPKQILEIPRFGCLNVHTSLLPKYRGAAPIQWALLEGESETGVTIMRMDEGLDTGDIVAMTRTEIRPDDDAITLHDRLAILGAELLARVIPSYLSGHMQSQPQPAEGSSYARKIRKEDGEIDWGLPAAVICNKVRALVPWPTACTWHEEPSGKRRLKVLSAKVADATGEPGRILKAGKDELIVACGNQALSLLRLQAEGGKPLDVRQFLAGHKFAEGYGFAGAAPIPSSQ